jgi:hypothetical protein
MLDAQVSTPGHIACMYKPPHHDTYEHQSRDVKSHMLLWRANCVHVCGKRASWRLLGAHSIGSRVTAHVSLMYILEHVGSMLHDRNKILTCDCRNLLDGCLCSSLLHFTGLQLLINTNWSF